MAVAREGRRVDVAGATVFAALAGRDVIVGDPVNYHEGYCGEATRTVLLTN
jgi:hypothetical protein